jgi:hypothetical protein
MDSEAIVSRTRRRHTSGKSLGTAVSVMVALAWVELVMTSCCSAPIAQAAGHSAQVRASFSWREKPFEVVLGLRP